MKNTQDKKISRIRKYTMETNEENRAYQFAYKLLNNRIRTHNFLHNSHAYYYSCLSTYWATEAVHDMVIIYS